MNTISETAEVPSSALVLNSHIGDRCLLGANSKVCYSELGDLSYLGDNTKIFSSKVGKFCSISWNVTIGPGEHQYNRITSHAMLYAKRFGMVEEPYYNQYADDTIIGNDVWIGCGSVVRRGVTIGDGCVIGANSIISKSTPPYSIVVGVNRIVGYRFSDEIIKALLNLNWWEYPLETIKNNIDLISQVPTLEVISQLRLALNK